VIHVGPAACSGDMYAGVPMDVPSYTFSFTSSTPASFSILVAVSLSG
jgi:hypothetical protein